MIDLKACRGGSFSKFQTIKGRVNAVRRSGKGLTACFYLIALFCWSSLYCQEPLNDLYFTQTPDFSPTGLNSYLQDREGYLWFCTLSGLYRYDGERFRRFKTTPSDTNSLSSSYTHSLIEDQLGKFWISSPGAGLNVYHPERNSFTHLRHDRHDPGSIASNQTRHLAIDHCGAIWVTFEDDAAVDRIDASTGEVTHYHQQTSGRKGIRGKVTGNVVAKDDRIYFSTSVGLQYYDYATDEFLAPPLRTVNGTIDSARTFFAVFKSGDGKIWCSLGEEGIGYFEPGAKEVRELDVQTPDGQTCKHVFSMGEDSHGRLWLYSTFAGFWSLSADRNHLNGHRIMLADTREEIVFNDNRSFYLDRQDNLWIGEYSYNLRRKKFRYYRIFDTSDKPLFINDIVYADEREILACVWQGYARVDCNTGAYEFVDLNDFFQRRGEFPNAGTHVLTRYYDRYTYLDEKSQRQCQFQFLEEGKHTRLTIVSAKTDYDGDLWISAWGRGLYRIKAEVLDECPSVITEYDRWTPDDLPATVPTLGLLQLLVDRDNNIWVCGSSGGITRIDKKGMIFTNFPFQHGTNKISCEYTASAKQGDDGSIWIATRSGGLNRLSPATGEIKIYNSDNLLASDDLISLDIDKKGKVWFTSQLGLASLDPATERVRNYNLNDGLITWKSNLYVNKADHQLYLAGEDGFHIVNLDSLEKRPELSSPIRISEVKTFDQKSGDLVSRQPADWQNKALTLTAKENNLVVQFSVLDFRNKEKNRYRYALTRGEALSWVSLNEESSLNLSQLGSGTYDLYLAGRNSDLVWSTMETPLRFTVLPPWWKSNWAYFGYCLLLGGGIFLIYRSQLRRRLAIAEAERIREMDGLKSRLYTNITHEFRTPLTVILGLADRLKRAGDIGQGGTSSSARQLTRGLDAIQRNGEQLLGLINQLLDLARLESGRLGVSLVQTDVIQIIRVTAESLRSKAEEKRIDFVFSPHVSQLRMDCDQEKLRRILTNLLANAFKFTPTGGRVRLMTSQVQENGVDHLSISLEDNGIGIPARELDKIFDRFFQVDGSSTRKNEGSGIGLALVRELTGALGGKITVQSKPGKSTVFTVQLPITRNASMVDIPRPAPSRATDKQPVALEEEGKVGIAEKDVRKNTPLALVIEDNRDVADYLRAILEEKYQVAIARNGTIGIEQALKLIPDVIISDVMMPEKDGFAVCQALKQDYRTSHVPIILLTAKADVSSRLRGLSYGADAYLSKPFNQRELFIRLEKLIALRREMQRHFSVPETKVAQKPKTVRIFTLEEDFMESVRNTITQRLGDPTLSPADIALAVNLSSTQLFRKMKALTGLSPGRYLLQMRLALAKQRLETSSHTVAEIAYATGFTDPNYFSRAFRKAFGYSPTSVRKAAEKKG